MEVQVTLLEFLQRGSESPACEPLDETLYNTRNLYYKAADISHTGRWAEFNLPAIQEQYSAFLKSTKFTVYATQLLPRPFPPDPVVNIRTLRTRAFLSINDGVADALYYGFESLKKDHPSSPLTSLFHDDGDLGSAPDSFTPDLGFFDRNLHYPERPNRAPGVCQLSSKWSFALQSHPSPAKRREFKQLLSKVNWYMRQHHTRYGFILTDREFVAIRRLDGPGKGNLELSDPVSWEASGTVSDPRLTILLGLWYLGMLAADEENCFLE